MMALVTFRFHDFKYDLQSNYLFIVSQKVPKIGNRKTCLSVRTSATLTLVKSVKCHDNFRLLGAAPKSQSNHISHIAPAHVALAYLEQILRCYDTKATRKRLPRSEMSVIKQKLNRRTPPTPWWNEKRSVLCYHHSPTGGHISIRQPTNRGLPSLSGG